MRDRLRVASSHPQHHYHRSLYDPIASRVEEVALPPDWTALLTGQQRLPLMDVFHLHWPEHCEAPDQVPQLLRFLRARGVRVVWTQHNLEPHRPKPHTQDLYRDVAGLVDGVIHHSRWAMQQAMQELAYPEHALHRVVPHGHFGNLLGGDEPAMLPRPRQPAALRLGLMGAPRASKDVVGFAQAFSLCGRTDLTLDIWSLYPHELDLMPDDPRIRARAYQFVGREAYNAFLAQMDIMVMPMNSHARMLASGVVWDAVAAGVPVLGSDWPYLPEVLEQAWLPMGAGRTQWTAALQGLSASQVQAASLATAAVRQRTQWPDIARLTEGFLQELCASGT